MNSQDRLVEPTKQEIVLLYNEMRMYYQNQPELMQVVVEGLYQQYVLNRKVLINITSPQMSMDPQDCDDNTPLPSDKDMMIKVRNEAAFKTYSNELQFIMGYQLKMAAMTFLKHGPNIHNFKQQINRQGGLFQVTENRYRQMTTNFVATAYDKILQTLDNHRFRTVKSNRVQSVTLWNILLDCRKYYCCEDVQIFLEFVAMAFDETKTVITVLKSRLISFYRTTHTILEQQLKRSRVLQKTHYKIPIATIPAPGKRSMKLNKSPMVVLAKTQKESLEQTIINIYIQYQKIGETKQKFQIMHGYHEQYALHREIQNVIFKWCRKAMKDIGEYCQTYHQKLPFVEQMSEDKVKQILTSGRGVAIRVKLLLVAVAFKRPQHPIILGDIKGHVCSWKVEPDRLFESEMALLVGLVNELNTFYQAQEGEQIQLFDGKPPRYKAKSRGNEMQDEKLKYKKSTPKIPRRQRQGNGLFNHRNVHTNKRQKTAVRRLSWF